MNQEGMKDETKNEYAQLIGAVDVQVEGYAIALYQAERLDAEAALLRDQADALRCGMRPMIRLDLLDDGLIRVVAWRDGRFDSSHRAVPLDEALKVISSVVQVLRQPEAPWSENGK